MVWQEKRKPSVFPALWQKRRKAEKPSAVPLFFAPAIGDALIRDTIISLHNNGRTRLHLLIVQRSRCSASSAGLYALCLAPPGTSLKGRSCLLLCVFAFDGLMITPEFAARQDAHLPKKQSRAEKSFGDFTSRLSPPRKKHAVPETGTACGMLCGLALTRPRRPASRQAFPRPYRGPWTEMRASR